MQKPSVRGSRLQILDPALCQYVALRALRDRDELEFFSLLLDHPDEVMPLVYTPTVGAACEHYHDLDMRTVGIYFTPADAGKMEARLRALGKASRRPPPNNSGEPTWRDSQRSRVPPRAVRPRPCTQNAAAARPAAAEAAAAATPKATRQAAGAGMTGHQGVRHH